MGQKYAIHPDFKHLPALQVYFNRPFISVANAVLRLQRRKVEKQVPAGLSETRIAIPASHGRTVPALVMRPDTLAGPAATLVYYHGGGYALTHAAHHLGMCREFALEAGCQVVFPDYRLLPVHDFAAAFDDCYDTLLWALDETCDLDVDRQRVVVGGDSAGGGLAAGVAQKALDNGIAVAAQLLIYPVADSTCSTESMQAFVDTPVWNGRNTERMWQCMLPGKDRHNPPPYMAPGLRRDLAGLPPAYLDTAEFDPLRDEGDQYARDLAAAGVAVEHHATRGTVHGFELAADSPVTRGIIEQRVSFLRRIFATG